MVSILSGANLKERFAELVQQCDRVDVAVAWATSWIGLDLLLGVGKSHGKDHVRIISGIYDYITTPKALEKMGASSDLRIYGTPTGLLFHPKLYIFEIAGKSICWVGSANLTRSAFQQNIEAIVEFEDSDGVTAEHFRGLWDSTNLTHFSAFDLPGYEKARLTRNIALAGQKPPFVEEDDSAGVEAVPPPIPGRPLDFLTVEWNEYLHRLSHVGHDLNSWISTLDAGYAFVSRDWDKDLSEKEEKIMFGHDYKGESFAPFGHLRIGHAKHFRGASLASLKNRRTIGSALGEVRALKNLSTAILRKSYDNLLTVVGCGPALATRLLVFARPDWFVVVNKKSFHGLSKELKLPVNRSLDSEQYAKLIEKIQQQPWSQSPSPEDPVKQRLWKYRAALIDPLVYEDTGEDYSED